MKVSALALALGLLGAALPAGAASYSGVADGPSVVWITGPIQASAGAGPEIRQTAKAFVPAQLVIAAGTSVRFPNDDGFYHSVYSESPSNPFDLGLYDMGPGKSVEFDQTGIVEVRCHVHGSMRATIVVVDGPFAVTTKPDERYRLDGLSRGKHVLHVWTDGPNVATTDIVAK